MSDRFEIAQATYGKTHIAALSWACVDAADRVRDVALHVMVEGAFLDSFRAGDNTAVLPSDTLRRHALAEYERHMDAAPEDLAGLIAARLLAANPALDCVTVSGEVRPWRAIGAHSFTLEPTGTHFALRHSRLAEQHLTAGITGLTVLLTAGSSFTGFLRDELTEQADSTARPLLGTVDASWTYRGPRRTTPFELGNQLTAALADRTSNSIQQLITEAAAQLLGANDELASVQLKFTSTALTESAVGIFSRAGDAAGVTSVELRRPT